MHVPDLGAPALTIRRGDTLSLAGRVTLPAGTWAATCRVSPITVPRDSRAPFSIDATLTLIGPNESDSSKNDWTLVLSASSTETAQWPVAPAQSYNEFIARIKFADDSTPPIVRSSNDIKIQLI